MLSEFTEPHVEKRHSIFITEGELNVNKVRRPFIRVPKKKKKKRITRKTKALIIDVFSTFASGTS